MLFKMHWTWTSQLLVVLMSETKFNYIFLYAWDNAFILVHLDKRSVRHENKDRSYLKKNQIGRLRFYWKSCQFQVVLCLAYIIPFTNMDTYTPVNHKSSIYHCFQPNHDQDDPDNDDINDKRWV